MTSTLIEPNADDLRRKISQLASPQRYLARICVLGGYSLKHEGITDLRCAREARISNTLARFNKTRCRRSVHMLCWPHIDIEKAGMPLGNRRILMLGRIIALSLTVFISIGVVLRSALGEVAPVNVSGSWTIDTVSPDGSGTGSQTGPVMCRFQKYAGNNFTGSCVAQDGQGTVTGTINGKEVQWRWQWVAYTGNSAGALEFEGTLASDDAITGSVKWNILPFKTTGRLPFTAKRHSGQQIGASAAAEQVGLLLVLSSDVSRSVDHPKFLLQREGYAAAISDPQVIEAIKSGPHQSIALCYIEWSGFAAQKLLIDWSLLDGPGAARKFGDRMRLWAI